MTDFQVTEEMLRSRSRDWEDLAELMRRARRDLEEASLAGLPPAARGAASAFRDAWAGYAAESAAIAVGYSGALGTSASTYGDADEDASRSYERLDSRLGPAR